MCSNSAARHCPFCRALILLLPPTPPPSSSLHFESLHFRRFLFLNLQWTKLSKKCAAFRSLESPRRLNAPSFYFSRLSRPVLVAPSARAAVASLEESRRLSVAPCLVLSPKPKSPPPSNQHNNRPTRSSYPTFPRTSTRLKSRFVAHFTAVFTPMS